MPSTSSHSDHTADLERAYAADRKAVLGMLRADFPRLRDLEEIYHDAWAELLELEAHGEQVRHRRALLKKIAWRRAADAAKRRRPETLDPSSPAMSSATDHDLLPDEQAQLRLDGEALRLIVESLQEQQATVLKLRFDLHLTAQEIQQHLGIGEKRFEAIITEAYKKVAAHLVVDEQGHTTWTRRQRSLLLACELGIASARQRRQAQMMVNRDPRCRAMLHAMRTGMDDVAAALPMPVLVEEHDRVRIIGRFTGRLDELWLTARQLVERLTAHPVPTTNLVEQAGLGGASVGASATVAKIIAVCLAAGGSAALCIEGARQLDHPPAKAHGHARHQAKVTEPPRVHITVVRLPKSATPRTPQHKTTNAAKGARRSAPRQETPVSSVKWTAPASPAPEGSTEFGPGTIGSAPASTRPAAAPSNGGGEFTP